MRRIITGWHSPRMQRWMDIAVYGHFGTPVLLFPTAAADFLEYERFLMMDTLKPLLDQGRIKIYSINTINSDTWLSGGNPGRNASWWHNEFSYYITEEVVPFIYTDCGGKTPIITTGASFGALHAANHYFKRPDIFRGTIAMSGSYDLHDYTKGYSDDLTFFNSPVHYMKDWHDGRMWNLHASGSIILATGQGNWEKPSRTTDLSGVLHARNINHWCDVWGNDMHHDWPTWRSMLPYFLNRIA